MPDTSNRSQQLDRAIADLLSQAPEIEAAAVVSFDGLPMASALPATMDEDRVAAMSAALLSLGERAAEGLGRGALSQVYIEGEHGTMFLVSADDEAVLVAVAAKAAKVGMMLYEVRRVAASVAAVLRTDPTPAADTEIPFVVVEEPPVLEAVPAVQPEYAVDAYAHVVAEPADEAEEVVSYSPTSSDPAWASHLPNASSSGSSEPQSWS